MKRNGLTRTGKDAKSFYTKRVKPTPEEREENRRIQKAAHEAAMKRMEATVTASLSRRA